MCEFISFSILQNISGISKRKYTQKPRAMQMNFFNLLYRGATVFLPQANICQINVFVAKKYFLGRNMAP